METIVISVDVAEGAVPGPGAGAFYCGFSLYSADGCHLNVRDGDGGLILDPISISAGQSVGDLYGSNPLLVRDVIFVELVDGDLPEGSIRYR